MINVVIINKSDNLEDIDRMLESLLVPENNINKIFYISDRCSEEFNHYLLSIHNPKLVIRILEDNYEGRRSSSLRNIGYSYARMDFEDGVSGVLFIDGDRYFLEGSTKDISESEINNIPVEMLRSLSEEELQMFKSEILNLFYSACVYLPKDVCLTLEDHQYKGLLWNEDIESIWGIEDLFMGNQLNILGIDYKFNKKIKLNDSRMTGYKSVEDNLVNMDYLVEAILSYKEYISKKEIFSTESLIHENN